MNDYIIETNDLTKKYGNQVCWAATEQGKRLPCACFLG